MSEPAPAAAAVEEEKKAVADASAAVVAKGKEKAEMAPTVTASAAGARGRFVAYPARVAEHADVVADATRFRAALEGLHAQMGTRLKVPIIGGKDLDLHQLYKEVTSRGGIDKVKAENRWREVTASFIFPATATNASFMLKKYYMSLLYHFEQLYFFRVQVWHQQEIDSRTNSSIEVKTEAQAYHKRKRGINASPSGELHIIALRRGVRLKHTQNTHPNKQKTNMCPKNHILRRKKHKLQGNNYNCVLCSSNIEETAFHLFFSCPFSQACWQHLGINWDFTMDFFRMMQQAKVQHSNPFFMETFTIATWQIWKQRNNFIFD